MKKRTKYLLEVASKEIQEEENVLYIRKIKSMLEEIKEWEKVIKELKKQNKTLLSKIDEIC